MYSYNSIHFTVWRFGILKKMTFIITQTTAFVFWPVHLGLCYILERWHFLKHKPTANFESSIKEDSHVFFQLLINFFATVACAVVCDWSGIFEEHPYAEPNYLSIQDWPTIILLVKILLSIVAAEVYFYVIHRGLHVYLYSQHKMHHTYTSPRPLATLYCSVFEIVVLNFATVIIGPLICAVAEQSMQYYFNSQAPFKFTAFELAIWSIAVAINITIDHSGLVLIDQANRHRDHHWYNNCNYSVFGYMDSWFGTTR